MMILWRENSNGWLVSNFIRLKISIDDQFHSGRSSMVLTDINISKLQEIVLKDLRQTINKFWNYFWSNLKFFATYFKWKFRNEKGDYQIFSSTADYQSSHSSICTPIFNQNCRTAMPYHIHLIKNTVNLYNIPLIIFLDNFKILIKSLLLTLLK